MNTFGRIFRVSVFGESHGQGIGLILDGVPAGISLSENDFETDLSRRRSGAAGTTPRREADLPAILSGVFDTFTTGAPLAVFFGNTNTRSSDYDQFRDTPRPGHADFTARAKYQGYSDPQGGGHFSGRITLGMVAAGVLAKKILDPVKISAEILEIGGQTNLEQALESIRDTGDSLGGLIQCRVTGIPAGIGEPFFDSLESVISHLVFAIPAVKGIEFGSGFAATRMRGSQHNDPFISAEGQTLTNNAGGINGGISNGNDIVFRVAVKPTSSISLPQQTINLKTRLTEELVVKGRHDACIALRMPVIIEAAAAIGLCDLMMVHTGKSGR